MVLRWRAGRGRGVGGLLGVGGGRAGGRCVGLGLPRGGCVLGKGGAGLDLVGGPRGEVLAEIPFLGAEAEAHGCGCSSLEIEGFLILLFFLWRMRVIACCDPWCVRWTLGLAIFRVDQ